MANDEIFRIFCLTCRESGIPASKRLKIGDEVLALDIDNAVSLRLLRFDTVRAQQQARLNAYEVGRMLFGGKEDDDVLSATELHDLVRNDPYADENTIIS